MRCAFVLLVLVAAALAAPSAEKKKKPFGSIEFDRYWSLEEIYDYMDQLANDYPEISKVEQMGRSDEGREIRGLRIASEEHLAWETLPIMLVTAGKSARDWITVMSAVEIMHELVEHHDDFPHVVNDVEWFVIPVANPDGYEFSRTEGNRDWIKNRVVNAGSDCMGVNIERNFNFNWGLSANSSDDPCNANFRGPEGDSEEETKTIQFAVDITQRLQWAYVSLKAGEPGAHSMVTIPFSSNNELFMPNFQERLGVGNIMTDAIQRLTGARYRVASESAVTGFVSGTSGDYAAGQDNIPLVYTIFAPSGPENGWDTPISQINRIADEIFAGVEALAEYVANMPLPDPIE